MKKTFLFVPVAFALALSSLPVSATSDSRYPASDFQPKVIFSDEALTAKAPTASKTQYDPKYPATHFEPKVVFADPELIKQSKSAAKKSARTVEFDPKYPAANFQPKVIYP